VSLPTDPKERKALPVVTGVLDYFPDAIAEVARISKIGNDQHNPGQPLHWAKEKSTDHADCIGRHLTERGTIDTDGARHSAKLAWRALANLQIEIEAERAGLTVEEYNKRLREAAEKPTFEHVEPIEDLSKLVRWDKIPPEEPGDDVGNRKGPRVIIQHIGGDHYEGAPCGICESYGKQAIRGRGGV